MAGLILPPGAVEVQRVEEKAATNNNPDLPLQMPFDTTLATSLYISFNSDLEWPRVVAHFDKCLIKAGFVEKSQALLATPKYANPAGQAKLQHLRHYEAAGRQVRLVDRSDRMERVAGFGSAGSEMAKELGRYELWVY